MREQEPKIRDAGGALAIVGVGWPAQAADFLKRFPLIEVVGEPKRVYSTFVKGYDRMMVRINA